MRRPMMEHETVEMSLPFFSGKLFARVTARVARWCVDVSAYVNVSMP